MVHVSSEFRHVYSKREVAQRGHVLIPTFWSTHGQTPVLQPYCLWLWRVPHGTALLGDNESCRRIPLTSNMDVVLHSYTVARRVSDRTSERLARVIGED